MGFVPRFFKNTSIIIGFLCICLFASNSHASTKILVWGDSLSAAYGIPVDKGWVSLLDSKLGDDYNVINGSISGETTQGGMSRLPKALATHKPDLIIIELGANDGLRGIPPQVTNSNLQKMIEQSKQAQAKVVLFGMKIPPNYGVVYSQKFEEQFAQLATDYELPFIPFFLNDVIENLEYFQADQLHPTAEAQPIILETIMPTLKSAIKSISHTSSEDRSQETSTEKELPKGITNPA